MPVVLGLDLGTSKLCAVALETSRRELLSARSCPAPEPVAGLPEGRHEQSPRAIRDACWQLVFDLLSSPVVDRSDVVGIGITGQMHGVLLVTADLEPCTNLITWRDRRTEAGEGPGSLAWALEQTSPELCERTGCRLHSGYGGVTLAWLAAAGELREGRLALSLADYIAAELTGVIATEPTHAASWGVYESREGGWARDALAALGVSEAALPIVRSCAAPLAEVLPGTARALGLPRSAMVCSPVGDNQAAAYAALGGRDDRGVANLGTGAQVCIPIAEFARVEGFETRPMPFGGYLLVGASLCGGWAYAYLRQFLQQAIAEIGGLDLTHAEVYQRLGELASRAPRGAGGLRVDPRFAGCRENPEVRGSITGITESNLTPANLARATLEGIARELGAMWRRAGARAPRQVIAAGNASRWNLILLDILEAELEAPVDLCPWEEEAGAGAALAAAVGMGLAPDAGE